MKRKSAYLNLFLNDSFKDAKLIGFYEQLPLFSLFN